MTWVIVVKNLFSTRSHNMYSPCIVYTDAFFIILFYFILLYLFL